MNALSNNAYNAYTVAWSALGAALPRPKAILLHIGTLVCAANSRHGDGETTHYP